jgi:hypothetical protein
MGGGSQRGPLGAATNRPVIDGGTLNSHASPIPGPIGFKAPPTGDARAPSTPTIYHPGVVHSHEPCGQWDKIQSAPESGWWENRACKNLSAEHTVYASINNELMSLPLALKHAQHYLKGTGADFIEDDYIKKWLMTDSGAQFRLWEQIPGYPKGSLYSSFFEFSFNFYDKKEYEYAWGTIDRLDFEVNFDRKTIHVWFQDRYEWHPVYPGLYIEYPGDRRNGVIRDTNCVHAAYVEMKLQGATDFWMKGEATVPLDVILSAAPSIKGKE